MKSRISILTFALCLLLFHTFLPISAFGAEADEKTLTVLFTHDTHDHFLPAPEEGGGTFGGYTRLATLLKEQRAGAKGAVVSNDLYHRCSRTSCSWRYGIRCYHFRQPRV